jgi:hypothetical protein
MSRSKKQTYKNSDENHSQNVMFGGTHTMGVAHTSVHADGTW